MAQEVTGFRVACERWHLEAKLRQDKPPERQADVLSGLGPDALSPGDVLPIGTDHSGPPATVDVAPVNPPATGDLVVGVLPGPRADWCAPSALDTLLTSPFLMITARFL